MSALMLVIQLMRTFHCLLLNHSNILPSVLLVNYLGQLLPSERHNSVDNIVVNIYDVNSLKVFFFFENLLQTCVANTN